jgi:hypothetical protein
MKEHFSLTNGPTMITTFGPQPITQALDVSAYSRLELLLSVQSVLWTSPYGDGAGLVNLDIVTGMQDVSFDGWARLRSFAPFNQTGEQRLISTSGRILNYILWNVASWAPNAASVTFSIEGIGYSD